MFDLSAVLDVRYSWRTLDLSMEFNWMVAEDPTYAKTVLPVLYRQGHMVNVDSLEKHLQYLKTQQTKQIMKLVGPFSASVAIRRAQCRCGVAGDE